MPDPAWAVYFYRSPDGALPGEDFSDRCPIQVEAHFSRLLQAVAAGPPPAFPGGGYWQAMHGDMAATTNRGSLADCNPVEAPTSDCSA